MCKQFLSFVCLTGFALICAVPRAAADPAEDSDRKFLNNLENGAAPQPAPAPAPPQATAPAPSTPAPLTKIVKPETGPQVAVAQKPAGPEKTPNRIHKPAVPDRAQKPAEIAAADPAPVAAGQKIIVVQVPNPDTDRDQDEDQDHEHHHHHFFHRLFSRLLGQHPEDW